MSNIQSTNNNGISPVNAMNNLMDNVKVRKMFDNALKENSGAFISSLIDLYNSDAYLQKCNAQEVMMEALKAATLNLPINKSLGYSYIVPYKNKPTFTIGYKGLIQLAMRSGQYKNLNAGIIYEGMELEEDYLSGTFAIVGKKQSEKVLGYFAYFKLTNGFEKALYLSKEDIEVHGKKYSPAFSSSYSPWKTEFDTMGQKTVIRQLLGKYGVLSIEMQNVIKEEEDLVITNEVNNNSNKQILGFQPEVIEIEEEVVDQETGEIIEGQIDIKDIKAPF